jgi:peptidyl-dipeptidase A
LTFIHQQVMKSESYVGSPAVGEYLKEKVFKPGARYDWATMLKKATKEQLNPEHFTAQFV